MICEEAICDLCVYVIKSADGKLSCSKDPPSPLRNELAATHNYCSYFECRYAKEGLCKKKH